MPVSPTPSAQSSQSSTQSAILSLSQIPSKVPTKRKARQADMPSRETPEDPPSAPAPKKKAGRKKATQDGDAVERRRTQLRLAQRAYRERKESTIAELEKKSASLERALSEVYGIFNDYQNAVSSGRTVGRDGRWVQELASARQRLDTAVQAAGVNIEAPKAAGSGVPSSTLTMADNVGDMDPTQQKIRLHSGLDIQPADMLGYQFDSDPTASSFLSMHGIGQLHHPQQLQQAQQHFHQQHLSQQAQANLSPPMSIGDDNSSSSSSNSNDTTDDSTTTPTTITSVSTGNNDVIENSFDDIDVIDINPQTSPSLDAVLSSDWLNSVELGGATGYKNETVTFARRLFHYCMEQCYRMMTDPSYDPEKITQKMRYSLLFYPKDDIVKLIRSYLQVSRKEHNHTPDPGLIPWGNAGCHYPRPAFVQDWSKELRTIDKGFEDDGADDGLQSQGLYKYSPIDASRFPEEAFTYPPDGVPVNQAWFDSYDTEAYLRQRGVQFDFIAASATIEIEVDEPPAFFTSYSSATMPPSPAEELDFAGFGDWQLPDMDNVPELAWSPRSSETGENGSYGTGGVVADAGPSAAAASTAASTVNNGLFNIWDLGLDFQQPMGFMGTVGDELGIAGLDVGLFSPLSGNDFNTGVGAVAAAAVVPGQLPEPVRPSKVKRTVVVDVDRLISLLEDGAICLGRAPGFKKSVVDDALQEVIKQAW